ncbi:MAG: winged helix-turn-helix transcriptional regulator [Thaumarchaeota archaeon]|nr:winged helix-turn-helix transcriptional regulator [Nitrososphaerota archaeon]
MAPDLMEEVLSSKVRLRIMDSVSVRPRTLGELSDLTGISVQGVLRHLKKLSELGLVEEKRISRLAPKARIVYAARSARIRDYSTGGYTVVKSTEEAEVGGETAKTRDLERAAGDLLILRRRAKEEARRLGRIIDEAADEQAYLAAAIRSLPLSQSEKLVLEVVLTEDTLEDAARVLSKYYGLDDRRSIESVLNKARAVVSK